MSYSRWSSSHWYTFWCVQPGGQQETRNNARFEICSLTNFSAKELRDDMDKCLEKVADLDPDGCLDELKLYMKRFLADVDERYPTDYRKYQKKNRHGKRQ